MPDTDLTREDVRDRLAVLLDEGRDDLAAPLLADHGADGAHGAQLVALGELAAAF